MRSCPEAPLRIYGRLSSPNRVRQSYVALVLVLVLVLGIEIGVLADQLGVPVPEIGRQITSIIVQSTPSVSAADVIEGTSPVIRISPESRKFAPQP